MYNTGSDVLGVLIARAAGQALETFLRERIFDPLGMVDTGFSVPADEARPVHDELRDRIPSPARSSSSTRRTGSGAAHPHSRRAAGGLVSTADDFLAFGQMLLDLGRDARRRADPLAARPSRR